MPKGELRKQWEINLNKAYILWGMTFYDMIRERG